MATGSPSASDAEGVVGGSRTLRWIANGWWVAVAGLIVTLAVLVLAARGPSLRGRETIGDGRDPTTYGFDLSSSMLAPGSIVASGMPRDGLAALHEPGMLAIETVEELNHQGRGKFLLPNDRVVGLAVDSEARAYPVRFMRWHEVVNDSIAERPVLVTYSPLCDAAVACDRSIDGEVLEFGHSGLLLNSDTLLYDHRESPSASSLWTQLGARAISGPAAGRTLELLPVSLCTWQQWREQHPTTLVLAPPDESLKRVYKRDPYHSYFGSELLRFRVEPLPPDDEPALKDRVLILTVDGRDTVLSLDRIAAALGGPSGTWSTSVDGLPVDIDVDLDHGAALVRWPPTPDREVASRQAFWFAWYSQTPQSPSPGP